MIKSSQTTGSTSHAAAPNAPANVAASRTLDSVAKRGPAEPLAYKSPATPKSGSAQARERMWPALGWRRHLLTALTFALVALAAYWNSFGPGKGRSPDVNWTLDNKYIIQLDPRTKSETFSDTLPEPGRPAQPGWVNIWTKDYWWPKGISGLYRPVTTTTYWFNWHVIGGDENRIDPNVERKVIDEVPATRRVSILQAMLQREGATAPSNVSADPEDRAAALRDALRQAIVAKQPGTVRTDDLLIRRIDDAITNTIYNNIDLPTRVKSLGAQIADDAELNRKLATTTDPAAQERLLRDTIRDRAASRMMSGRLLWFHVVNYLMHVGVAVLVYLLGLTLTKRFWVAAAMGLLFTTHPIATESVTNIIGRADIFSGLTVLGGLLLYIRSTKSPDLWKLPWLIGLMLLTVVGEFSKESAVAIIFVVPLYDLIYRFSRDDVKNLVPTVQIGAAFAVCAIVMPAMVFMLAALLVPQWWDSPHPFTVLSVIGIAVAAALLIGWAILRSVETGDWAWSLPWRKYILPYAIAFIVPMVTLWLVRGWVAANATPPETPFLDNPIRGESWFAGRLTAAQVVVRLWWLLIWPYHLSCDYSHNQMNVYGAWLTPGIDLFGLFSSLLIAAILLTAAARWRKNRALVFYILFFFLTYFPTSNFVLTIGSIMAERFMYLPFVGFIAVMALGLEYVCRRIADVTMSHAGEPGLARSRVTMFASVVVAIALVYGARTFKRNFDWQSDVTLWQSAKDISPNSFRSYQSYAFALYEEVELPEEKRQPETKKVTIDDCIFWASKGRPIVDPLPHKFNSSRLYLHLGMYYQKKAALLADKGPNGEPINNAQSMPYYQAAIEALERAVPVDRTFSRFNRQKELQRGKKIEDIPDVGLLQVYQFLGDAYLAVGRLSDAREAYEYMRHLDPTNPDAYVKIAMVYQAMVTPEAIRTDPSRAATFLEQEAIAIVQALWLDGSRTFLWPPLEQVLTRLNQDPSGPVIAPGPDGKPRLMSQRPIVASTICSAYEGFIRRFLESKLFLQADRIYEIALNSGFPKQLFDDIYKQFGRPPPTWPPAAPTAMPGGAAAGGAAGAGTVGGTGAVGPGTLGTGAVGTGAVGPGAIGPGGGGTGVGQQSGGGAALPKPAPRDAPGSVR